ncbi:MAG TPA: MBL fold metallo-hydrolase [Chitinophagaceae bacterium]|nr:MBL fold metallo-hydrolase [Chitinophagaceae bacterium]
MRIFLIALLIFSSLQSFSQNSNKYEIFALKFADGGVIPASEIAIGDAMNDSVKDCSMIWLLKGNNGKNILIDAGFTKNVGFMKNIKKQHPTNYISPLDALKKVNIVPDNITDVIITHPHADHIDGIDLFPKAMVWMQKEDYNYFVGEAWQKNGTSKGFDKADVTKIVAINLDGRLILIKGDSLEIIPGLFVFTGSKHTWESQYILADSKTDKVIIASDNIWYYYNLEHLLAIPMTFDPNAYVAAMKRMKTLVSKTELIIPGHDNLVFKKFPVVTDGVVRIR